MGVIAPEHLKKESHTRICYRPHSA